MLCRSTRSHRKFFSATFQVCVRWSSHRKPKLASYQKEGGHRLNDVHGRRVGPQVAAIQASKHESDMLRRSTRSHRKFFSATFQVCARWSSHRKPKLASYQKEGGHRLNDVHPQPPLRSTNALENPRAPE